MKKGQILLGFLGITLLFAGFLVIIILNNLSASSNLAFVFRRFINLKSIEISGLRYALFQINQNRDFTATSARIDLPHGYFLYSVATTSLGSNLRIITIQSYLTTTPMTKTLSATATIDISSPSSTILNLEISD